MHVSSGFALNFKERAVAKQGRQLTFISTRFCRLKLNAIEWFFTDVTFLDIVKIKQNPLSSSNFLNSQTILNSRRSIVVVMMTIICRKMVN